MTQTVEPQTLEPEVILPDTTKTDDTPLDLAVSENLRENSSVFGELSAIESRIVVALCRNIASDGRKSQRQIARDLGTTEGTIIACRSRSAFTRAMGVLMRETVRGNTDNIIQNIYEHMQKDWKAGEFLLKYSGEYVPSQQNLNISAKMTVPQYNSRESATDAVLIKLGELGWTAERISDRFNQLRAEGAF